MSIERTDLGTSADMTRSALAFVLRAHAGVVVRRDALLPDQSSERAPEQLAEELRRHGVNGRIVELGIEELRCLRLPTLIQLRSGASVVLREVRRRHAVVAADDGSLLRLPLEQLSRRFSGIACDLSPTWPERGGLFTRVLALLQAEVGVIAHALGLAVLVMALALVGPLLSRLVIDRAFPDYDADLLQGLALASIVLGAHTAWLGWLRTQVMLVFEARIEVALHRGMFEHSLRLPFADAQKRSVGSYLESLQCAVEASQITISGLLTPVIDLVLAIGYLTMLALTLPELAAVALGLMLLSAAITFGLGTRIAILREAQQRASVKQYNLLHELLSGALTLKALGAELRAQKLWLTALFRERSISIAEGELGIWLSGLTGLCQRAIAAALFAWGGAACLEGELTLGGFLATSMFVDGFVGAVTGISSKVIPLLSLPAKLRQVDELLLLPAAHAEAVALPDLTTEDAVRMDDVWFRYAPDTPWILEGYSLRVPRGENFVLRGTSGMGKSTILRLIAGLLQPERGTVRVFGRAPSPEAGLCAYLPQEPSLLSGSILSNLRLLSGAEYARIVVAAEATGLATWLEGLPMGLNTVVPPGGGSVSGGERQLILLTAAVASERPLLLLDESLAHVDRVTRSQLAAGQLFKDKTLISVVHDV